MINYDKSQLNYNFDNIKHRKKLMKKPKHDWVVWLLGILLIIVIIISILQR